jgi:argininosuccinate synthase
VRLHNGQATAVGRQADAALYDHSLATYDRGDTYDQGAAVGFIKVFGLPARVQAKAQLLKQADEPLRIATPDEGDE